ncbi:MAG: DUF4157 domain-containing protein [Anaerotignum sp.]|nr:DUF4157 domain-containing protein [Anaerotignum sp.]
MSKAYYNDAAEREANKIGEKFAHSSDVAQDMARAYHTDFSNVKIHTDDAADRRVKAAGKDALVSGNNLFFGKGIFESREPAAKALVGHELAHTMQQDVVGGTVAESAPMGAVQGGVKDWFENLFSFFKGGKKEAEEERQSIAPMADADIDAIQLSTAPQYTQGMSNKEKFAVGGRQHATDQYKKDHFSERDGLNDYIQDQYKGTEQEKLLMTGALTNASTTTNVNGLMYIRMLQVLDGSLGEGMSKEDIKGLYDDLLGGGNIALKHQEINKIKQTYHQTVKMINYYKNDINMLKKQRGKDAKAKLASKEKSLALYEEKLTKTIPEQMMKLNEQYGTYSQEEVEEADQKFDRGFLKLKGMYLKKLRHLKEKYGTYPTQMHPDDFISKIGIDYFEDTSILQDTAQMITGGAKYFDFENNPDDAEFRLLSNYYQNANSQLGMYFGADANMGSSEKEFDPTKDGLDFAENRGYMNQLMGDEAQIRELDGGNVTGFDRKQQISYNKNVQKRYEEKGWLARLLGRFKKR